MTSEAKVVVSMIIQGAIEASKLPFLTSNRQIFSLGQDRFVIVYGTQQRMENDAEEALEHALSLRSKDRKIWVSTSKMIFEQDRPMVLWQAKWDQELHLINQNEIGVSLDLVRIYQRIFDLRAKKILDQTIFVLESQKAKPERIRGLEKKYLPLVGRKKELGSMLEVMEQSFKDQGQIVSIVGEAGLGKTRLTEEFKRVLKKKKIPYHEGFFSLNSGLNFRGFHQLVSSILDQQETFSKWNLNDSESAFLRYFLHPEQKNDIVQDLNEEEQTQGIFRSIQKLLRVLGDKPVVLILDDFHWAGEKSVQLMDFLSQELEKTKIAFFIIHRPTFLPSFQKQLNYLRIELAPLVHEETKELVQNTLHLQYVTDDAIRTLNHLSLGNPLYVEEVLRELIAQKKIDIQKSKDIVQLIEVEFPKGVIPTNLHALLTSRLDLLPKDEKEILRWACVFGYRESYDDFELFLQTHGLSISIFEKLFQSHYLVEASMFPDHRYKFRHDLLYETVRQSIAPEDWMQKNQKIALFLYQMYQNDLTTHGDRIADFYIQGTMGQPSFEPIFEVAKIALHQKRYSSAMKYFDQCYKLLHTLTLDDPSDFYEPYLEALFSCGKKKAIKRSLDQWGKTIFLNHQGLLKFYKKNLEYFFIFREVEDLQSYANKAILIFEDKIDDDELFQLKTRYFQSLVFQFKFSEAVHQALKLLRKANGNPSLNNLKVDILYGLGFITQQTAHPDVGTHIILIAKTIADEGSDVKRKIKTYQRLAYLAGTQGSYKEAIQIWSTILNLCHESGYTTELYIFRTTIILNKYFLGKYSEAFSDFNALPVSYQYDWNTRFISIWIGQGYLFIGAFQKVKELIAQYRYYPSRDPYIRCNLFYLVGNYHFHLNEYRKAKIFYGYAKKFYLQKDQKIYGYQMQAFELRCKLLLKEVTPEEAGREFDFIFSHEEMRKYFYEWFLQMMSYSFARLGCQTRFKPSPDFDPMKCNAVYLRMMMFVEKTKWLESIGETDQAQEVKKQYLKHRKEMATFVPDEYQNSYLEHPFYQI